MKADNIMVKTYKKWGKGMTMKLKIFGAVVISLTICALTTFSSMAANDGYVTTGPATGVSCTQQELDDLGKNSTINKDTTGTQVTAKPVGSGGLVNAVPNEDGTFTFEGKRYRIEKDGYWGQRCLTGYSGGGLTASGKKTTAYHTIAGPRAMLGKVVLVKANRMLRGTSKNMFAYDGIYVFEDTGGEAVEKGNARTMNEPVVDIYFDTYAEANGVTDLGSIVADVYILTEVK